MPARVQMPLHQGVSMLGVVAEQDIEAKTVIMRGRGFWWAKDGESPDPAAMGLDEPRYVKSHNVHMPWGVDLEDVAPGVRYIMNASCPISLVNDFRNIAAKPNASLVSASFNPPLSPKYYLRSPPVHIHLLTSYSYRRCGFATKIALAKRGKAAPSASRPTALSTRASKSWWTTGTPSGVTRRSSTTVTLQTYLPPHHLSFSPICVFTIDVFCRFHRSVFFTDLFFSQICVFTID